MSLYSTQWLKSVDLLLLRDVFQTVERFSEMLVSSNLQMSLRTRRMQTRAVRVKIRERHFWWVRVTWKFSPFAKRMLSTRIYWNYLNKRQLQSQCKRTPLHRVLLVAVNRKEEQQQWIVRKWICQARQSKTLLCHPVVPQDPVDRKGPGDDLHTSSTLYYLNYEEICVLHLQQPGTSNRNWIELNRIWTE